MSKRSAQRARGHRKEYPPDPLNSFTVIGEPYVRRLVPGEYEAMKRAGLIIRAHWHRRPRTRRERRRWAGCLLVRKAMRRWR